MASVELPPSLARRFELATTRVTVAGHEYVMMRPGNIDDLISEAEFDIDERIPYWAECWPSSWVLAERLAKETGAGRKLLELGCGIGLLGMVAARSGFDVLSTDYYADALEFTAANAARHGVAGIDTRLVDWRRLPDDLGTYDLVVGADVLYEKPQSGLVAGVLAKSLAPGGLGLISDPGRRNAEAIVDECATRGLTATLVDKIPTVDNKAELTVSIYEVRWTTQVRPQ